MSNLLYFSKLLFTGGGATALDGIDGDDLTGGDYNFVTVSGKLYIFKLNAASSATENSPFIIAPDTNPGTKRWELIGICGAGELIIETTAAHTASAAELYQGVTYTSSYAGETIITLPAGAAGYKIRGLVTVAQYLQFLTNGTETIRFLATQSAAGGYVRANVVGNTIEMEWSGSEWVITGIGGAWTYDS